MSILNVVQIITYAVVYERISTDERPKVIQQDSSKTENIKNHFRMNFLPKETLRKISSYFGWIAHGDKRSNFDLFEITSSGRESKIGFLESWKSFRLWKLIIFGNLWTTFDQFSESALVSSFSFHKFGQNWPLHFK